MSARHEVRGSGAMGFLSTKPTIIITTLHDTGVVNAGVFGAYTNVSPTQVAVAVATPSDTYKFRCSITRPLSADRQVAFAVEPAHSSPSHPQKFSQNC